MPTGVYKRTKWHIQKLKERKYPNGRGGQENLVRGYWIGKKFSQEHRRKISIGNKGKHIDDKTPFWKGGIGDPIDIIRHRLDYRLWREAVFKRDNYTCQNCGSKKNLHPHHIKKLREYPELKYVISNGVTICRRCHPKVEN